MSEKKKPRAMSITKGLGVPSANDSGMGGRKKSLSRVSSSVSQSDTGRGRGKKKKHALLEEEPATPEQVKKAMWDQMLAQLKAGPGLDKLRKEMVQHDVLREKKAKMVRFTVRKINPNYRKRMSVAVAVPAPSDVKAVPLTLPAHEGPRLDKSGRVVPHSILGSVEKYIAEAQRRGVAHVVTSNKPLVRFTSEAPKIIPANRYHLIKPRLVPNVDEVRVQQYWRDVLVDRERQRANIIAITGREPSEVIMGDSRTCSKRRLLRWEGTLDGVLATGTRGTGFWGQPDVLGHKDMGLFTSLTRSQRGYSRVTDFRTVSEAMQRENGYAPPKTNRIKLDPIPNLPRFQEICTTGRGFHATNKVECGTQTSYNSPPPPQAPITQATAKSFPSLRFAGHSVTWCDDVIEGTVVKAEMGLECFAGDRDDSTLEVTNTGQTAVAYDWKRLPGRDPFCFKRDAVQRFYFDHSYGTILPGETKHIATSFKSPGPGVYTEAWGFETTPRLCGGGRVLLTIWGIARDRDVNRHERHTIEKRLSHNQAVSVCQRILHEVISCINTVTPEEIQRRRKSYTWVFEDAPRENDHFEDLNPGFFYHSHVVRDLLLLNPESGQEESESDVSSDMETVHIVSLATLKKNLEDLPEDNTERNGLLNRFTKSVNKLTFSVQRPVSAEGFYFCRCLWSMTIDDMVTCSLRLRDKLGISSEENMPEVMVGRIKSLSKLIKGRRKIMDQDAPEEKPSAKEKPAAVSSQNRRKSIPAKSVTQQTAISKAKEQVQQVKQVEQVQQVQQVEQVKQVKQVQQVEVVQQFKRHRRRYKKYREKLHCEMYGLLVNMADRLGGYLSSLDAPRTSILKTQDGLSH